MNYNLIRFSRILLSPIALLVLSLPSTRAADAKPNFLVIAIDDLNDYVGCLMVIPMRRLQSGSTGEYGGSVYQRPLRFAGLQFFQDRDLDWFKADHNGHPFKSVGWLGKTNWKILDPVASCAGEWVFKLRLRKNVSSSWKFERRMVAVQCLLLGPLGVPKVNYNAGWTLTDWGFLPSKTLLATTPRSLNGQLILDG